MIIKQFENNPDLVNALSNHFPEAYFAILDKNLTLKYTSGPKASKLQSFIGQSFTCASTVYGPNALQMVLSQYRAALDGVALRFDVVNNGEFEHHSVTPVLGDSGFVDNILCVVENVTEQRKSLAALRASEAHLKVATALAKIGYWELDVETMTFTFNDQFIEMLKVTKEELGGNKVPAEVYAQRFLLAEDMPMIQSETQMAIDTDDPNFSRYIEHRLVDGEGNIGYLGVRYIVVKDESGKTVKTVGANQDITKRKLAEQSMRQLLDKTSHQNKRLKDFSFMTSHNIRSSVANLMGLTQLITDDPDNREYITMLCTTVKELDNTVTNINKLLNFERSCDSELDQNCQVKSAIQRFMDLNVALIQQTQADIHICIPDDLYINCVPAYLDSIFHNIISNAIKYGIDESSKKIEIGVIEAPVRAVYIQDFGPGMDLNRYGDKLFKLGVRLNNDGDGLGLGLYMTRHQIESMGGSIRVFSEPGKGTRFEIFWGK